MARPTTPPPDDGHTIDAGPVDVVVAAPTEGLVKCRWLSPQPVVTGAPGPAEVAAGVEGPTVVCYGDAIWLTVEQADDPATPAERWSNDWQPEPDVKGRAAGLEED